MQCLTERNSTSDTNGPRASDVFKEKNNHDWRGQWRYPHHSDIKPVPTQSTDVDSKVLASLPVPEINTREVEQPKWGWGARREARRQRKEDTLATKVDSAESEEVQKIKEAVDKIWAERKQAAVDIQATANEKVSPSSPKTTADNQAKEYARVKLETLSQAVDTLRAVNYHLTPQISADNQALTADAEMAKDPKIV